MRLLISALIVAFPLLATAQQVGKGGSPHLQFVGFTGATFNGGQGVRTYTEACQDAFTASARMCTSVDVLATVAWPRVPNTARGWVRPVYQGIDGGLIDASGIGASLDAGALSCGGWSLSTSAAQGLAVSGDGRFATPGVPDSCDTARPVACCAP